MWLNPSGGGRSFWYLCTTCTTFVPLLNGTEPGCSRAPDVVHFPVMEESEVSGLVAAAEAAVGYAQSVRAYHRKHTDKNSVQRKDDLHLALGRLKEAMAPIRSEIGRFTYLAQNSTVDKDRERLREASLAMQVERRKLWKMRPKNVSSSA